VTTALPKYANPPVVEVALSVQFEKLNVKMVQLGRIWDQFRERFPQIEEKPELDSVTERFGSAPIPQGVRFEMGGMPMPRLWFVSESGCDLVQLQRDRFIRNWRKTEGEPDYPTYEKLREQFSKDWGIFCDFVRTSFGFDVKPNQCEVTYVNIIDSLSASELQEAIAWVGGNSSDGFLGAPEDAEITLRYLLRDEKGSPWGRLHIAASSVIRASDEKPVVRLTATVRGTPPIAGSDKVVQFLDQEHEAVVKGFTSITTPQIHRLWERQQ
jgi:uncharacterized protein (TIGR04255 family)